MKDSLKNNIWFLDYCSLEQNWWIFALRGILAIVFACFAFFMPIATMLISTIIFGVYAVIDGIFSIASGVNKIANNKRWGGLIVSGTLSIIVGLIVLIKPLASTIGITTFFWTMLAIWAVMTGIFQIFSAIRLFKEAKGEFLLAVDGILSILLGSLLFWIYWLNPLASIATLGLFIAAYSLASGIMLILLAYRLYRRGNHKEEIDDELFSL